ncbi:MAG: AIM24 family protein [Pseudomonadota bacterium]
MSHFEILEKVDPCLKVYLNKGESCYCASGRTVMMDATLDLKGQLKGNIPKTLFRKMLTPTSFFFQNIVAQRGAGECLIAPLSPGSLYVIDIGENQYSVVGSAFLAASSQARVSAVFQDIDKAFLASTGGFFILETEGLGQITVAGYGSLHEIQVTPGHPLIMHNEHVIAWEDTVDFSISLSTTEDSFFRNVVNNYLAGAGFVLRFSGYGKIIVCSRSRENLSLWVQGKT